LLGTRWGQEGAKLVPAPGDPWYATYTYDPLNAPFSPPPAAVAGAIDSADPEAGPAEAPPAVPPPPPAVPAPASPDLQLAPMDSGGH
jgi:hypothetical protein